MIAPADIDQFDVPLIDRIMAAEITTGLHDGKHWAFEGRTPASRALRYELVLFPHIKNREMAERHEVGERYIKKQRTSLRSYRSAMAKLREAEGTP